MEKTQINNQDNEPVFRRYAVQKATNDEFPPGDEDGLLLSWCAINDEMGDDLLVTVLVKTEDGRLKNGDQVVLALRKILNHIEQEEKLSDAELLLIIKEANASQRISDKEAIGVSDFLRIDADRMKDILAGCRKYPGRVAEIVWSSLPLPYHRYTRDEEIDQEAFHHVVAMDRRAF